MTSFWKCRLLPCECRLLARKDGVFISTAEIARQSGISIGRVWWISRQRTWDKITIAEAEMFLTASGIVPEKVRREIAYLKRALREGSKTFPHLRRLPIREQRTLLRLIR